MTERDRYSGMFGGLTPSTGVRRLVKTAFDLGLDPSGLTSKAGAVAKQEGRTKVGLFGNAGPYIENLRDIVVHQKWQQERGKLLNKSKPR